ncbi:MAG: type II toxin-antitoxin system VapC family toxin [Bryobacteraceae bacterium]
MKLLLDTCAFLWAIAEPERLSRQVRELLVDPANEPCLSVVSVWEIGVKYALGRLPLPQPPAALIPAQRRSHGIETLALEEEATLYIPRLPKLHLDPFDRMLICQAIVHGLSILTPDGEIAQYPVRTIW